MSLTLVFPNLFKIFSWGKHGVNVTKLEWLESLSSLLFGKNNLGF